jgi:hypothetical protein
MANIIPSIPGITQNVTKMAFTDLITALLGTNSLSPSIGQNVTNFFNTRKPSLSQITNFQSFETAFQNSSFLLGQIQNPVVQLYLNPETITVSKNVLLDKKQTRGGFVVQFWGHDLQTIEVKAATAYFQLSKSPLAAFELLKSQVYQARFNDTQPFQGTPIISMLYESQVLNGYFNNFNYVLSSTAPYYFTYSFTFTVTQNVTAVLNSNIATTAATLVQVAKTGNLNVNTNTSAAGNSPIQFSSGWGVQLF